MDPHKTAAELASLLAMDADAVHIYDEALDHVTDADVRRQFSEFRDEHDYHATVLAAEIRRLREEPPEPRPDLPGEWAELITHIRARTGGDEGAVAAMRSAERYHARRYREAEALGVGQALHEVLARFHTDEQRHLEYCERRVAAGSAR